MAISMTDVDKAAAETRKAEINKMLGNVLPPKPPPGAPQEWSLWEEATSMDARLAKAIEHLQQMRADIQHSLRELERIVGTPPKPQ